MGRTIQISKIICICVILSLTPISAYAAGVQVDALLSGLRDSSGNPLSGGKVYTYSAGTTAAKALYQDRNLTIPHANPVVLDSAGKRLAFGSGKYKFVIKTATDVTILTADDLAYTSFLPSSGYIYDPLGAYLYQTYLTASQASIQKATIASLTVTTIDVSTFSPAVLTVQYATITASIAVPLPSIPSSPISLSYFNATITAALATVSGSVTTLNASTSAAIASLSYRIETLATYGALLPVPVATVFDVATADVYVSVATFTLASNSLFFMNVDILASIGYPLDCTVYAISSVTHDASLVQASTTNSLRTTLSGIASGQLQLGIISTYPVGINAEQGFRYLHVGE